MTTTITAAVARDTGAPLTVESLELDALKDNEVRSPWWLPEFATLTPL
ncbi:hypothetical protein [Marinobacter algicola]